MRLQRRSSATQETIVALAAIENRLIERLPRLDRVRLLALCVRVPLASGDILCEPGQTARHAFFPIDAIVALITLQEGRPALDVGMVGREGMVGVQLALGTAPVRLRAKVQREGSAWRISTRPFRAELQRSAALRRELLRHVGVLMDQLATSAACLRFHEIGPRLARWLLMNQDRAHGPSCRVTHEYLAAALGVRRVGITQAAGALQGAKVIEYRRGEITVLDRAGLEAAACGCYAADQRSYLDVEG